MLVLLRITIGWHFLYQGLWKLDNPSFTSAGFLSQAKGPWADDFHALIPDYYGYERLDEKKLFAKWENLVERAKAKYSLTPEQQQRAAVALAAKKGLAQQFFVDNEEPLKNYFYDLNRWREAGKDPHFNGTEFHKKRVYDKEKSLLAQAGPWLNQMDSWGAEIKADIWSTLTPEQRARGDLPVDEVSLAGMDQFITFTNIAIGLCLMVGLFTRFASFSGAVFLLSIVLSQPEWPGIYPPAPAAAGRSLVVTKEVVEMVAMFALAALPVGRWGGLDFFVHNLFVRRLFGKRDSR